ncbi:MAG: hypothetical protein LBQ71_02265 [Hungatella sp.]|jgi:hypothetical protein|nr:hypothetical protein [Hungatella sp.]
MKEQPTQESPSSEIGGNNASKDAGKKAKAEKGIRLHPKYGLNPTMPMCFYCGKPKGEIALLGASYKDEAPTCMIVGIEPCSVCKENFADYTLLVEAEGIEEYTPGQRVKDRVKPTGRWCAIRKECLNVEHPSPVAYTDSETMDSLLDKKNSNE